MTLSIKCKILVKKITDYEVSALRVKDPLMALKRDLLSYYFYVLATTDKSCPQLATMIAAVMTIECVNLGYIDTNDRVLKEEFNALMFQSMIAWDKKSHRDFFKNIFIDAKLIGSGRLAVINDFCSNLSRYIILVNQSIELCNELRTRGITSEALPANASLEQASYSLKPYLSQTYAKIPDATANLTKYTNQITSYRNSHYSERDDVRRRTSNLGQYIKMSLMLGCALALLISNIMPNIGIDLSSFMIISIPFVSVLMGVGAWSFHLTNQDLKNIYNAIHFEISSDVDPKLTQVIAPKVKKSKSSVAAVLPPSIPQVPEINNLGVPSVVLSSESKSVSAANTTSTSNIHFHLSLNAPRDVIRRIPKGRAEDAPIFDDDDEKAVATHNKNATNVPAPSAFGSQFKDLPNDCIVQLSGRNANNEQSRYAIWDRNAILTTVAANDTAYTHLFKIFCRGKIVGDGTGIKYMANLGLFEVKRGRQPYRVFGEEETTTLANGTSTSYVRFNTFDRYGMH